jgi:hypothetical protein
LQSSLTRKLKLIRGNPLEPLKQSFQRKKLPIWMFISRHNDTLYYW